MLTSYMVVRDKCHSIGGKSRERTTGCTFPSTCSVVTASCRDLQTLTTVNAKCCTCCCLFLFSGNEMATPEALIILMRTCVSVCNSCDTLHIIFMKLSTKVQLRTSMFFALFKVSRSLYV
jgi:hypothetical protein